MVLLEQDLQLVVGQLEVPAHAADLGVSHNSVEASLRDKALRRLLPLRVSLLVLYSILLRINMTLYSSSLFSFRVIFR